MSNAIITGQDQNFKFQMTKLPEAVKVIPTQTGNIIFRVIPLSVVLGPSTVSATSGDIQVVGGAYNASLRWRPTHSTVKNTISAQVVCTVTNISPTYDLSYSIKGYDITSGLLTKRDEISGRAYRMANGSYAIYFPLSILPFYMDQTANNNRSFEFYLNYNKYYPYSMTWYDLTVSHVEIFESDVSAFTIV